MRLESENDRLTDYLSLAIGLILSLVGLTLLLHYYSLLPAVLFLGIGISIFISLSSRLWLSQTKTTKLPQTEKVNIIQIIDKCQSVIDSLYQLQQSVIGGSPGLKRDLRIFSISMITKGLGQLFKSQEGVARANFGFFLLELEQILSIAQQALQLIHQNPRKHKYAQGLLEYLQKVESITRLWIQFDRSGVFLETKEITEANKKLATIPSEIRNFMTLIQREDLTQLAIETETLDLVTPSRPR